MAKNQATLLTRKVEYKDGKSWRAKTVTMHVDDVQAGLKLMSLALTDQHGIGRWRYAKTNG